MGEGRRLVTGPSTQGSALRVAVFEGYDGSGKTTLMRAAASSTSTHQGVVCIGRKTEPVLADISSAIEKPEGRLVPEAEFLLRVALEVERWGLVRETAAQGNLVFCDRGVISLLAWPDYLGIGVGHLAALVDRLIQDRCDTLNFVCLADFETCWARIEARGEMSAKERRGKDANRRFFDSYLKSVDRAASAGLRIVTVSTQTASIDESTAFVASELTRLLPG